MNKALLPLLLALTLASPALAQDAPPQEILVERDRPVGEIDPREVRQQTQAVTPRGGTITEPLARFQVPVCVGVWGLSGASADFVIDRIYANAAQAGLTLDRTEGCAANVIAAFVPDPQEQFRRLVDARHQLVAYLTQDERNRVTRTQGPVLAWYLVSIRTAAGETRMGRPPVMDTTQMSRLDAGTRRDLELAVVMIDSDMLADLDAVALADYATMRALARTRPVEQDAATMGDQVSGTVLALFDDPLRAPQSMTDFDRAYLASLYDGRATLPGTLALRDVDERMEAAQEPSAQ